MSRAAKKIFGERGAGKWRALENGKGKKNLF